MSVPHRAVPRERWPVSLYGVPVRGDGQDPTTAERDRKIRDLEMSRAAWRRAAEQAQAQIELLLLELADARPANGPERGE
jgi:hypothetical protein